MMNTKDKLSQLIEQYIFDLQFSNQPAQLYDSIRYSLEGGGKRLRPLVALMACDVFGGDVREALPLAAAVEVFHNFTLLHDDIMDNAPVRRGKPAVHARWGANTAILAGDVMLIYAYKLLALCPQAKLGQLLDEFNLMGAEVCEGQQYDVEFEGRGGVTEAEYMHMISLKTAALIARAAKMGAIVAGASEENSRAMYRFGYELGLAFQLQDDLLDSYGDDPAFGKKVGGDIIEGKMSFLAVAALLRSHGARHGELKELLVDHAMPEGEKVSRVRALYDALGVPEVTAERIRMHTLRAIEALDGVAVQAEQLTLLRELALSMLNRKK